MDKRALRQKYKEIRKNVNNDGIAERFISSPLFLAAKSVMTYISINNEPDTSPILLHSEKTVLVPVTYKESGIIKRLAVPTAYRSQRSLSFIRRRK